MTHASYGPTTLHAPRRRRRAQLLLLALVLAAAGSTVAATHYVRGNPSSYLSSDGWPGTGQGAYQIGSGRPAASPGQRPAPIASLAKVMTAVVVLALLLPSANNVAVILARWTSGSVAAFVAEMNRTAHRLGMAHTTYTDPSGFDAGTVSTAVDQLTLARAVARDATLTAMTATRSYRLPVAGVVHNTNKLLGTDGFVGTKTGSDDAPGGCVMFRVHRPGGDVLGVVLGQPGDDQLGAGLDAARELVDRLRPAA